MTKRRSEEKTKLAAVPASVPSKEETTRGQYCSWCFARTVHTPVAGRRWRRNQYRCAECGQTTVPCMAPRCTHMARGSNIEADEGAAAKAKPFCADHAGEIASFERLAIRLSDLADYGDLFRRDSTNYAKIATMAITAVAGTVVAAPVALFAVPTFASALGATGLLGTAATGTKISTLTGAALTKASLAAIGGGALSAGGGGVALGSVIVVAAGSALGGVQGAVVSNAYFRDVKEYTIRKLRSPTQNRHSYGEHLVRFFRRLFRTRNTDCDNIVFINGFLQQHDDRFDDWLQGVRSLWPHVRRYGVVWESKSLVKLGRDLLSANGPTEAATRLLSKYALSLGKKPGVLAGLVPTLLANPWHTTMVRSQMVGAINADLLCRVEGQTTTLMGHSLGARTIYYTLQNLSQQSQQSKPLKPVKDVFLFGGAVDRNDAEGWRRVAAAVAGHIYNFFSTKDLVLKLLYSPASGFSSEPIGLGRINCDAPNIVNVDSSDLVSAHDGYKTNLGSLLERAFDSRA